MKIRLFLSLNAILFASFLSVAAAEDSILNASYDVSRELFKEINAAFVKQKEETSKEKVSVKQSHGGSSKQARAVIEGLEADVVTLNQVNDIHALVEAGKVSPKWREAFPFEASPYSSITAFIVRKGNPKNIKDWDDLIRDDVKIALVNPKTGGNGRYTFLAAYGYALKAFPGDEEKVRTFLHKLYSNVPVLDTGGRAATTTFAQRGIGDVLITFESEVKLIEQEFGKGLYEVVVPSLSIQADFPVAIVDTVVEKRGSRALATDYLTFLFSDPAQEIAAQNYLRPRSETVKSKYADQFASIDLIDVDEAFGGWTKAKPLFDDGGFFDQIYTLNR
jgi:sulfate transport system substrate-binding protein